MRFERTAGILLHPTSLPGFGGIGSLGAEAFRFIDTLKRARIGMWQVLPLGPTGYGDSPYSSLAAFAGNPLLIALEPLVQSGLLDVADLEPLATLPDSRVDFGGVVSLKAGVLRRAFERFPSDPEQQDSLDTFRAENAAWLEDTALFLALKDEHSGAPWIDWEPELRRRDQAALEAARARLLHDIEYQCFVQWHFLGQWQALKRYANDQGIRIVGDIPIFVANDSADVWANQRLFQLDDNGIQTVLAGVPPDYFSETGQLWGNPHYRWDVMQADGFGWWIERFRAMLALVDVIRLDHFRGFAAAWAVPYGESTAVRGEWVPAPGRELFQALRDALGEVPIIAEDLGVITPDVEALRDDFGFPGMYILEFAFGTGPSNPSLPQNMRANSVVYTGTHDNDTTVGWFYSVDRAEQEFVLRNVQTRGTDIALDLIRLAMASTADIAIVPLQDVLRLGPSARMNSPGRAEGNWTWRYLRGSITEEHVCNLAELTGTFGRSPGPAAETPTA